jgi:nitrate reductase gamma subunit
VLCFKTLWERNRALWLWSWLLHVGLYSLVLTAALTIAAAASGAAVAGVTRWTAGIAICAGMSGSLAMLAMRVASPRLRPFSTWLDIFNLLLIASVFGTGAAAFMSDARVPEQMATFLRSLFGTSPAPRLTLASSIHLAMVGVFLAYFPATHMTHAYMKFFTFHRVRWDDTPVVHDSALTQAMSENLGRPISWAAPHIAGSGPTWSAVVARVDEEARR